MNTHEKSFMTNNLLLTTIVLPLEDIRNSLFSKSFKYVRMICISSKVTFPFPETKANSCSALLSEFGVDDSKVVTLVEVDRQERSRKNELYFKYVSFASFKALPRGMFRCSIKDKYNLSLQ